jgi:hypothetical protein
MNIFVLALLGYLLYRFIGGFLLPLFRTTRHMHQHFQDMNGKTNNGPGNMHSNGQETASSPGEQKSGTSKVGEYIDFEEIH